MRTTLFLMLLLVFTGLSNGQEAMVDETVTTNKIKSHIYFLAADAMKGRETGSNELNISAEYISSQFRGFGVRPLESLGSYFQEVPLLQTASPIGGLSKSDVSLAVGVDVLMMSGTNINQTENTVYLDFGSEKEFSKADVEGKLVITQCGTKEERDPRKWIGIAREKSALAKKYGAKGLVELYNSQEFPWTLLVRFLNTDKMVIDEGEEPFLSLWVNNANNERTDIFKNDDPISIKIEGANAKPVFTKNVVGIVEGTDEKLKNEYIVYSAHYDHVGIGGPDAQGDSIYNGARDNAVGTVTVLTMAENLAKYPTKRSALFILFTAEEKGLLGSRYFTDHPPIPLDQLVYCFNSDNGGYNDTSLATIIGLSRTTAKEEITKACKAYGLKATDDPVPAQGLFDRSDNVNFAKKGIPAPTFGMGLTDFDEEIRKYYHQPADNPETLDYDYLTKFFRAYVYSGRLIADRKERPYWVKGDKYFEAAEKLYKK